MTQHECSRVGCTRLTSEQECDLHAVKMTGVVHPQKEPRPSLTREGFAGLVGTYEAQAYDHGYCEGCASYDDEGLSGAKRTAGRAESRVKATGAALLAAFDSLAAERDEWKRRAEKVDSYTEALKLSRDEQRSRADKAEAERDAARAELAKVAEERDNAAGLLDVVCPSCGPCPGKFTDEDGCCKTCGEQAFFRLLAHPKDPRIRAWRELDAEQREIVLDLMRGAPQLKIYSSPTRRALGFAAAALEALGERP